MGYYKLISDEGGLIKIKFDSWKHFASWINEDAIDSNNYIWRGQKNAEWELIPSIDRVISSSNANELSHLRDFKLSVTGRRGQHPPKLNDLEWWALGQHHGLYTPLLDWTKSPFVALFFAFEKHADIDYRAVYCLDAAWFSSLLDKINTFQRRNNESRYQTFKPELDENYRMIVQDGLFTYTEVGISIEAIISEHLHRIKTNGNPFIKCYIKNDDWINCLKSLNRMTINDLALFPDIIGASKFTNMKMEIENY